MFTSPKYIFKKISPFFYYLNRFLIPFSAFTAFIIYQVFIGVNKYGRWQFAEFYAMAERFLINGRMYVDILSGEFDIQSLYFPGVSFLIMPFIKFTDLNPGSIMSIIVMLSFSLLFVSMQRITNQVVDPNRNNLLFLILGFILFFGFFMFYLTELKPDPLMISLAAFLALIVYDILNKKITLIKIFSILIIAYLCGILKQQSISIYIALSIFCLCASKYSLHKRIIILTVLGLSGILVLITILNIENAFFYTIKVPATHGILSLRVWGTMLLNEVGRSWFYIAVVSIAIITNKRLRDINSFEVLWLIICLCFGIMSFISFLKSGGNEGNLQTGLIVFLPFFCQGMSYLLKNRNISSIFLTITFLIIMGQYSMLSYHQLRRFRVVNEDKKVIHKYLSENFKGRMIGYVSNDYWLVKNAGLIPYPNIDTYNNYINNQKEIKIENMMDLTFGRLSNIDFKDFNQIIIENLNDSRSVFVKRNTNP